MRGTVSSLGIGNIVIQPADVTTAAPIGTRSLTNLAAGDNTVTLPTGYTTVILIPPAGNTNAIILKGAGGDTGRRLHNTNWQVIHFDSSVTTFILNAAALTNNFEMVFI